MLIPKAKTALLKQIDVIFSGPARFGLKYRGHNSILFAELLEVLVGTTEFFWLASGGLKATLEQSNEFQLSNSEVTSTKQVKPSDVEPIISPISLRLFYPSGAGHDLATLLSTGDQVRLYHSRERGTAIASALTGSWEGLHVWQISTRGISTRSTKISALERGLFVGKGLTPDMFERVPIDVSEEWFKQLRYLISLHEVLNLNDDFSLADAARYLYAAKPKQIVELELTKYLADPDPDVRSNVLTALGVPVYTTEVKMDVPMPPRGQRLEDPSLNPETVRQIITSLERETDRDVLDYFVCTLKAQSYEGKLRVLSHDVRKAIEKIMPRISSPQTLDDCGLLLSLLPD